MRQLGVSAGLVFVALALGACGPKPPPPQRPPSVTVAHPLQRTVVDWDDYVGQFVAQDSVDIRPRVSGYLQSVEFKDGSIVKKGQLLFVIDPRPYQAALDQSKGQEAHAEAAFANAQTEEKRGAQLLAIHAISQQAYDALVAAERQDAADLVAARANVQSNALNLSFTRVTAPLAGRISDRRVAPGNLVTADSTVLTNIVNLDPIWFAFTGSESAYLKYQRENLAGTRASSRVNATPVELRLQDEPTYRWKGAMNFVDNVLDSSSGTIRGRAVVANPDFFLTPGMFGHMRLIGSGAYAATLVPDAAVVTDQTRQVIYVVGRDGTVGEREVVVGPLTQGLRVIRSGVGPGDLIVIDGVQRAKPGRQVTPVQGQIAIGPQTAGDGGASAAPEEAGSATIIGGGG